MDSINVTMTDNLTSDPTTNRETAKSGEMHLFMLIFHLLIGLIILFINGVVVQTTWKKSTLKLLICQLAVTDALMGLFTVYISISHYLFDHNTQEGSAVVVWECFCRLGFTSVLITGTLLTITAMTLDRLLALSVPFRYRTLVTSKRIGACIATIWLVSISVGLGPFLLHYYLSSDFNPPASCVYLLAIPVEGLVLQMALWYIVLITNIAAYVRIWSMAQKAAQALARCMPSHLPRRQSSVRNLAAMKMKSTSTVCIILAAILFCYGPSMSYATYLTVMRYTCSGCVDPESSRVYMISTVTCLLVPLNSILNPIIYGCRMPEVKQKYRSIFCLCCRRRKKMRNSSVYGSGNSVSLTII